MKYLSFSVEGRSSFGAVFGSQIVDLGARFTEVRDLREFIQIRAYEQPLVDKLAGASDYNLDEVEFLPTIPNPEKIVCIGVNYANRNAEYKDGSEEPEYPSVFMRSRESLVGHREAILDPPESDQLDYEGEIVLVIGKEGRRIPESEVHHYVAGTSIMNEGSVRDYLRHAKFNVTQGKNFEKSGSLGPWMVTADELNPFDEMQVITTVNGEERQNDVTTNLMFSFRYLVSYLSTFFRLKPGDLIATGTPNGAGARFDPPRFLKPQDRVEVRVPGVGTLENSIVNEEA